VTKIKKEHEEHGQVADHPVHEAKVKETAQEITDLKNKLEAKEKEATASYDKYLRAVADLDNYKKRAAKEKADIIKFGKEEIIKDILPFIDNLDRALEHAESSTGDIKAFKDGIKMIQDQLLCCLQKHGVEKIDCAGQDFNPHFHEAVMQEESANHEENKILNEFQKGYLLNGRLLRPSKVCVCKNTSKENNICEQIVEKED
jgi:molecular chaperone GrpE